MRYVSTPAQEELRAQARAFLADASLSVEVRRLMETERGYDPAVWESIVAMGWLDLPFPDLAVVLEEAGASLLCAPLLGTWLAAAAVAETGAGPPPWPSGAVASLAVAEDSGRWDAEGVTLRATHTPGRGWRLDGHKSFVLDGHVAEWLVVAARTDVGVALFLVDGAAPGLSRALLPTVDQTRKQARLELSSTPARLLAEGSPGIADGAAVPNRVLDLAATALAAEQVGGAGRCLEMTVSHVRRRVQFGGPIGTFQAVQHRCTDMLLEVESARSASAWATHAAARRSDELPRAAPTAKVTCSEAYAFVSTETIHLHGGLGFTWDHDAHLYFKRAKSSRLLFGDPYFHRGRLFRRLEL